MKSDPWLPTLFGEKKGDVDPFTALRSRMDDLFSDWSTALSWPGGPEGRSVLKIDVSETPTEITIKGDLPGVEEKDIDVTVSGDRLVIKAERKSETDEKSDEKGRVYHRVERSYGSVQRSMILPFEVDPSKVAATFKDGVLTVSVPKPPETRVETKRIAIKGGK